MAYEQPSCDICLIVLMGLPGSGKTTLSNFMKQQFSTDRNGTSLNVIHVCYDSLISNATTYKSDLGGSHWHNARQDILELVEKILYLLRTIASNGEQKICTLQFCNSEKNFIKQDCKWDVESNKHTLIIVDDNMYYRSMRHSYFQLARRHKIGFCQLYLNFDLMGAIDFNQKRDECERVPDAVIQKMAQNIERPGNKPWEQFTLAIPAHVSLTDGILIEQLESLIRKALLNPVQPIKDFPAVSKPSREVCAKSILHQADLALRRIISDRVAHLKKTATDSCDIQVQSRMLNLTRSEIFNALKTKNIIVPDELFTATSSSHPLAFENLCHFLSSFFP